MRTRSRLLLAGAAATLLLAAAVTSASANNLSFNATRWRQVHTPLTFATAGGMVYRCNVTLEKSLHSSSIRKVVGALIGSVTGATFNTCAGANVTVLRETLPWHLRYSGFSGTLPNITGIRTETIGLSFRIQPTGSIACLARSTTEWPWKEILSVAAGGAVRAVRVDETMSIPLDEMFCAFGGEMTFSGTGTLSRAGTTIQDITVRLI